MGFWTFGSYIGKGRKLVELESERSQLQCDLEHKIRMWESAPERIAELDIEIAELEKEID